MRSTGELDPYKGWLETRSEESQKPDPPILGTGFGVLDAENLGFDEASVENFEGGEMSPFAEIETSYNTQINIYDLGLENKLLRVRKFHSAIESLGNLEDNFDGNKCPPISVDNITAAKILAGNLYDTYGILCDEVLPTLVGGIEIEITTPFWELAILVDDPENIKFLVKIGSKRSSGEAPLLDIPSLIWEIINSEKIA